MIFIRQKRIYREDLKANPHLLYIFGDNLERTGYGGQAKEMRGEPNAFGIATKRKAAHGADDCYFFDGQNDAKLKVSGDFLRLGAIISMAMQSPTPKFNGIVVPLDGIGTGLALLNKNAPKLLQLIERRIDALEDWCMSQPAGEIMLGKPIC